MSLFFTYEDNLPADVGYKLYSATHIAAITVSIAAIILITVWYVISNEAGKRRIRRAVAVIPIIHFISLESYLFHALIIAYICIRLADKGIIPSVREAYKSILFLLVVVPPVYLFNVIFKTNFMFVIRPSLGSPLYGFYKLGGYAGYRIGYAFVSIAVIYLMNILFLSVSLRPNSR